MDLFRLSWMLGALNGCRSMRALHTHTLREDWGGVFEGPKTAVKNEAGATVGLDSFPLSSFRVVQLAAVH